MRILIIGSGGREHALAWKLAQSPQVTKLYVAPGNGGTAELAKNIPIAVSDIKGLAQFAKREQIDLTVVGPEAPLVAGLADTFAQADLPVFGPTAAAAQLEGSKAFAKQFMIQEGIPTAEGAILNEYEAAQSYLQQIDMPVVVKASGLAAGKGVFICPTLPEAETALHKIMVERAFGAAGDQVLIEACLEGEEASLLAFTDGKTVVPMLPARDYKRVGDGDQGPNTGGMGGYAPSPYLSPTLVQTIVDRVLQPAVDGMRRRHMPYRGVLYAGLMLTDYGPRVLEFNCRFGDPETQILMPLLKSDLVDILMACITGQLDRTPIHWRSDYTTCLVMASEGYPGKYETGKAISGVDRANALPGVVAFQAGTQREKDTFYTAGGRVLAVTATGPNLLIAQERAYAAADQIHFAGAHHRGDIGAGAVELDQQARAQRNRGQGAYAAAGVDIAAKSNAFRQMRSAVQSTYTQAVLAGIGSFGGLFALDELRKQTDNLVLVASTDGVGTKTMIAEQMKKYDTIGHDIVNHCINDVLVQGARPLFFLDYVASGQLDPKMIVSIVSSCAQACRQSGVVLIGGETAEMPGVYKPGTFDLVGTLIGWVDRARIIDGQHVRPGDICLGLPSTGLHTNGYSLARRVFAGLSWKTVLPELGRSVGEALLEPHKSYLPEFEALAGAGISIKAMSHITGGGFPDNLPRVLPPKTGVRLDRAAWSVPPLFRLIQERGQVDEMEMYHVFNMGVGMVVWVKADDVDRALRALNGQAYVIGETVNWDGSGDQIQL